MATASVTHALSNGITADGTQLATNFTDLVNFCNQQVVHKDGSVSMTGLLTLHAADPSTANHAARKSYVDATAQASLPPGAMTPWIGASAPTNWTLMYGQTLVNAQSTYPTLWANADSAFKSGSNLIVPDMRARVPVGLDNMGGSDAGRLSVSNTIGGTGGAETHALITAELPPHDHDSSVQWLYYNPGAGALDVTFGTSFSLSQNTTELAGSGTAHNNMQPYILLNWILKLQ